MLARNQMNGKLALLIGAWLLSEFILQFCNFLILSLLPGEDLISNILCYALNTIVSILFLGILQTGLSLLELHTACHMPCSINDLFYAFKHHTDKAIKVGFVFVVLNSLCSLPSSIMLWTAQDISEYSTLLPISYVSLLGTLVYALATLAIFPVFYLLLDFPNLTVAELFKKSFEIMKGNCIRYMLLQLSFLPIILLSVLTCGLALLWVIPYMGVTCANFYLDIMACRNRQMQQS